ncbi:MAG: DUF5615 family PIN-like protein [Armatimonadetes bacterium]|nr:DUF5615 family PIN-like protein [Armatimonadota bacterium]
MTERRFLVDENTTPTLGEQLRWRRPGLEVNCVGDEGALPGGTPDPEILIWLEAHACSLVTDNWSTMSVHLGHHLAAGRHVLGVFVRRPRARWGAFLDDLLLICEAADPEEYADRVTHVPL